MKIKNPYWHPEYWCRLTVAQRANLRRLGKCYNEDEKYKKNSWLRPPSRRQAVSFKSLERHGLARHCWDSDAGMMVYKITEAGRRLLAESPMAL